MKKALMTVFALMAGTLIYAQKGPKEDDRIAYGTFPNGLHYYAVQNAAETGFADFALVCRKPDCNGFKTSELLSGHKHIRQRSFQKFLSDNSVAPDKKGYAQFTDGRMSLRFSSVMLNRNPSLVDSLFLALFDAAESLAGHGVPLDELAIMVSGDLDRERTLEKMKIFSLMIQANNGDIIQEQTAGRPAPAPEVKVEDHGEYLKICGLFPFRDIMDGHGDTAGYAVMDQLSTTLGAVAVKMAERALDMESVPYADAGFSISKSKDGDSVVWKTLEIHFCTIPQVKDAAVKAFARALSSLPQMGYPELRIASRSYYSSLENKLGNMSNAELLQLCTDSFIFGSPLIPDAALRRFCRSREVADSLGLDIMQDFASAVVKAPADSLIANAWTGNMPPLCPDFRALEKLPALPVKKSRVRTSSEPLSGGEIYKSPNGFKVYFKRVPGAEKIHWAMSVGRGYSLLDNLNPGQAAFLSDILPLFSVCGTGARELQDLMNFKGITCETKVNLYSTYMGGVVSHRSLDLLMQILAGYFTEIRLDAEAVSDYTRNLAAESAVYREGRSMRLAVLDSLLCTGNPYSEVKMYDNFDTVLFPAATELFNKVFASADDAFVVISGDLESEKVKKAVENTAGMFHFTGKSSRKRRVMFQPSAGWLSAQRSGKEPGAEILMSTALPMTAENLCAASLTAALLKEKVREAIVGTGYAADVKFSFTQYPRERFSVVVSVNRISPEGYDLSQSEVISEEELMDRLRDVLKITDDEAFGNAVVDTYKKLIQTSYTLAQNNPEYWIDTIVRRYADGRDLRTKIIEKMNAVSGEKIKYTINALFSGSRIELIITNSSFASHNIE